MTEQHGNEIDPDGMNRLSAAERETLRLLATGHDVKSAARALDLTVHAVNERLRAARRKLGTTSSREAARLLALAESAAAHPNFSGDRKTGLGAPQPNAETEGRLQPGAAGARRRFLATTGVLAMAMILAALAYWAHAASAPKLPAAPHVAATTPAQGVAIAPGPFTLSVTYDRPMLGGNYSFVRVSPETYPECVGTPQQSGDGRTFSIQCTAKPGKSFEVWFNRPPFVAFMAPDGTRAEPFRLLFSSSAR
jgi:DNA-binding CsgD family transcriptional regulator